MTSNNEGHYGEVLICRLDITKGKNSETESALNEDHHSLHKQKRAPEAAFKDLETGCSKILTHGVVHREDAAGNNVNCLTFKE